MNLQSRIFKTAEVLKKGGVALISTDTVCGLAALYDNREALDRIYSIKKRDPSKPLALLIPSIEWVWKWADKNSSLEKICRENWPGALTLIIKTMNNGKIGLRMPDCAPLLHLMEITGPLCATSANISGEPAPVRTCDVPGEIRRECDVIESFGVRPHGRPSKVVDISSEKEFTLRE